jgi:hypothetical protein
MQVGCLLHRGELTSISGIIFNTSIMWTQQTKLLRCSLRQSLWVTKEKMQYSLYLHFQQAFKS